MNTMPYSARKHRPIRSRRAAALLVVLIVLGVCMMGALTLLASAENSVGISLVAHDQIRSRQVAESGIALTLSHLKRSPGWRSAMTPGVWVDTQPLLDGVITIHAEYTPVGPSSVNDHSFENETAALATPLLNPPMSGVIGGWTVERTALVQTGATVPRIGTRANAEATDGVNHGFISFSAAVTGSAMFRQNLGMEAQPNHAYEVIVDIATSGIPPLSSNYGFRIYAGASLLASTAEALSLIDGLTQEAIEQAAQDLLEQSSEPAVLITRLLGHDSYEHTLRFLTDDAPPAGELRIELYAESLGILSTVSFDNVRLIVQPLHPLQLTAEGRAGIGRSAITVDITEGLSGTPVLISWREQ